jgi:hypothetical protein
MPKPPKTPKSSTPLVDVIPSPDDRARVSAIASDMLDGLQAGAERFRKRQQDMLKNWSPRSALTTHAELTGAQIDAANAREWEAEGKAMLFAAQTVKELVGMHPALTTLRTGDGADTGGLDERALLAGLVISGDAK